MPTNPTIEIAGNVLPAAVCSIRGCRIYPPVESVITAHEGRHKQLWDEIGNHTWRTHGKPPNHKPGYRGKSPDTPRRDININLTGRKQYVSKELAAAYFAQVEQMLRDKPGQSIAEIARQPHPFGVVNGCRDAISRAVKDGRLAARIEKVGRRTKVWPI